MGKFIPVNSGNRLPNFGVMRVPEWLPDRIVHVLFTVVLKQRSGGWKLKMRTPRYEAARPTALRWSSDDGLLYVPESMNYVSASHVGLRHAGGRFLLLFPTVFAAIFGLTFHEMS